MIMADKLLRVHPGTWINPHHVTQVVAIACNSDVVIGMEAPGGRRWDVRITGGTPEDADRIALAVQDAIAKATN
jgi:hypothetical protein